ncbi:hypothetical protein C8A00DRAFT_44544 [Chaetomidium leptoderma]|uniref:HNH nuclease domain-containing protein n=1 Tax=Chaetomidium leptoderma TaxID=669021 RepID=A0AAN6VIW7_9PEZI|nr:hypothetical protein C8A00DRAFT_44544 [Chaetomidium leptoderma]
MRSRPASNDPAAIPASLITSASQPDIDFVHPGYDGDFTSATFLSLPRLDDGGVCFDTALAACGLIACNQWSGFFSTDKPGQSRVDRPSDGILRDHPYYYFHLPTSSDPPFPSPSPSPPYPIIPRFSDWSFPHHDLPAHWTRLQLQTNTNIQPMVVGQRAGFCVATNYSHGVDVAHCVPSNEREWWDLNQMDRYGRPSALLFSTQPQDAPANLVPLRSDFHRVFDERHLCFVPKEVEDGEPPQIQTRLLIHVVVPSSNGQVAGLWHNRALHALPPGLSKECLFARFAYTILSPSVFSSSFLSGATVARRLCTRDPETQIPGVRMEGPANCRRIMRTARSRSPRKRSAPPTGNGDDDGWGDHRGCGDSGYYEKGAPFDSPPSGLLAQFGPDPTYAMAEEEEEEEEGRGRKRAFEVEDEEVEGSQPSKPRRQRS